MHRFRIALAASALFAATGARAAGFDGFHVGAEAGRQNVIAGALVAGVDTLRQDARTVASVHAGYRTTVAERVVVGIEAGIGTIGGDLALADAAQGLSISYMSKPQYHFGLIAGGVADLAGETLLFAYLDETTRTFEVAVQLGSRRFGQKDEQGILRFGVGLERKVAGSFTLRVTVGSSRADFGDRQTEVQGGKSADVMLGIGYVFR